MKRLCRLRLLQIHKIRFNEPIKYKPMIDINIDDDESFDVKWDKLIIGSILFWNIFSIYTMFTVSSFIVYSNIKEAFNWYCLCTDIDTVYCSMVLKTPTCLTSVCVYKCDKFDCNVVKFNKLRGNYQLWMDTFKQLFEKCRCVSTGVSKEIEKSKFNIDENDKMLLEKYFTPEKTKFELENPNVFDKELEQVIEIEPA